MKETEKQRQIRLEKELAEVTRVLKEHTPFPEMIDEELEEVWKLTDSIWVVVEYMKETFNYPYYKRLSDVVDAYIEACGGISEEQMFIDEFEAKNNKKR